MVMFTLSIIKSNSDAPYCVFKNGLKIWSIIRDIVQLLLKPSFLLQKGGGCTAALTQSVFSFDASTFIMRQKASCELLIRTSSHRIPLQHPFHTSDYEGKTPEKYNFLVT